MPAARIPAHSALLPHCTLSCLSLTTRLTPSHSQTSDSSDDVIVVDDMQPPQLAKALGGALNDGLPYAFVGFAFGAVLAYEVGRAIADTSPGLILVSPQRAPPPRQPQQSPLGVARIGTLVDVFPLVIPSH